VTDSAITEVKAPREDSKFLIVSLRYAGDALLSTPLAESIKKKYPGAIVDYLVFDGNRELLKKNPFVRKALSIPAGTKRFKHLAEVWKKYDFSIGVNPSDRTSIYTIGAGKTSLGFSYLSRNEFWKRVLLSRCRYYNHDIHIVPLMLSQLESLGIPPVPKVTMGYDDADVHFVRGIVGREPFVIFHPYSRVGYKFWRDDGWVELARMVNSKMGLKVFFTVSPEEKDRRKMENILAQLNQSAGSFGEVLSFNQLAAAITMSRCFVGVDNVVTHIAAAMEKLTVGLFGPTWVHHWGLWPNGFVGDLPYDTEGRIQRQANIVVVQKDWPCVPCNKEVCDLNETQSMKCLDEITADEVFEELVISHEAVYRVTGNP